MISNLKRALSSAQTMQLSLETYSIKKKTLISPHSSIVPPPIYQRSQPNAISARKSSSHLTWQSRVYSHTHACYIRVGHPNPIWDLARRLEASQRLTILVRAQKLDDRAAKCMCAYVGTIRGVVVYHLDSDYLISNRDSRGSGARRCAPGCPLVCRFFRWWWVVWIFVVIIGGWKLIDTFDDLLCKYLEVFVNYCELLWNYQIDLHYHQTLCRADSSTSTKISKSTDYILITVPLRSNFSTRAPRNSSLFTFVYLKHFSCARARDVWHIYTN